MRIPQKHQKIQSKKCSGVLLLNIIVLALVGILMVYNSSVIYATETFGNKYHFLILQIGWVSIGLIGMYIVLRMPREYLYNFSKIIWIISIIFLIFVILPTPFAPEIYGAQRWLYLNPDGVFPSIPFLGRVGFQPSEFSKFACVIFFSSLISKYKVNSISNGKAFFVKYFVLAVLNVALVALQPNFSTSLILVVIISSIYFFGGMPIRYLLYISPVAIVATLKYLFSEEYRIKRIVTLFNPEITDKLNTSYHINQIMIALGSGGLLGLGLGRSRQKYSYLPEVSSDSIFAVIGEELGFVGAVIILCLLLGLVWQCFSIASKVKDDFLSAISAGVASWIFVQTLINLGAMVRILPITGIPLPLLSYGGSSAIFILLGLGLVLNASKYIE